MDQFFAYFCSRGSIPCCSKNDTEIVEEVESKCSLNGAYYDEYGAMQEVDARKIGKRSFEVFEWNLDEPIQPKAVHYLTDRKNALNPDIIVSMPSASTVRSKEVSDEKRDQVHTLLSTTGPHLLNASNRSVSSCARPEEVSSQRDHVQKPLCAASSNLFSQGSRATIQFTTTQSAESSLHGSQLSSTLSPVGESNSRPVLRPSLRQLPSCKKFGTVTFSRRLMSFEDRGDPETLEHEHGDGAPKRADDHETSETAPEHGHGRRKRKKSKSNRRLLT